MGHLDDLGSTNTYNHYPTGWAVAFSTPFQMFKRYSQFSGGTCDPLVIHWPKGIDAKGEVRNQYHHTTDIVPTILDVVGLEMPDTYRGVKQVPLPGVSMRYSFDDGDAPTKKERQYFAMLGTRGIWEDGWKASAIHAPTSDKGHFDDDRWELYHIDEDRSESKDLAEEHPEKLQHLIKVWFDEAEKYDVLPLDDRSAVELLGVERPQSEPPRTRYVYYPDTSPVPEGVAVNIRGRDYKILADVEVTDDSEGVLFAHGSRFGGHSLFIKDHKLYYVYNFLGTDEQILESGELPNGNLVLGVEFKRTGAGDYGESLGTATLYVNDKAVDTKDIRVQVGKFTLSGDGLCVGFDSADPVCSLYHDKGQYPFTGGNLLGVGIDVSAEQYLDLKNEAAAAFALD